ncbi:MAG: hypothetical protein OMM_09560 [Candidatus Magnetoglobus multicellularis str. Araruama]|uniref:Peptidase C-terminal archaeal/bacterial domain-containing protein n=1 Tax=Candidatus Magnetoglobus multicellularis str. Araruama TaxID=890399 RepID=A0A1V1P3U5_9BACT|nr:MAG: hypothetical protein OMM_09560 [Candidatus Magnetoglobus multicellularis str. Araruama]
MQTNIQLAYNALIAQGYYDEDIRLFSSNAINIANIQTVPLQEVNVLKDWIGETRDVTVYLTGKSKDSFMLTESNCLSYSQLNDALLNCDQSIVIFDSAIEQQYLENLSCENRIIVSSMNDLSQYSFSGFFWNNIQDGFTINKAFESAQSTFTLINPGQKPIIIEPDGSTLSKNFYIAMGVSYVPGEVLTSSSIEINDYIITADITSPEAIFSVFAEISYENQEICNIIKLEYVNNVFIAEIPAECFAYSGLYEVKITIVFSNGYPYVTTKEHTHTQGMDTYEPDNSYENATWYDVALFETQYHNFYEINDEDWIKFEVDEKDIHKISISQLGRENDVRFKLLKGMDVLYDINNAGLQSDEKFEIDLDPGTYYLCILPADESIVGIHTQYSLTIGKKSAEGFSFCATINDFLTNMLINNAKFYAFANGMLHSSPKECITLGNEDCDKVFAEHIHYFEETKIIGVAASKLEYSGVDLKLWPQNKGILILNIKSQGNPVTNASILPMCDQPYTITSDCFGNYTMINVPVDTVFQLNVDYFKPMSIQSTLYYKDVLESSQKFQVRTRFMHEKLDWQKPSI